MSETSSPQADVLLNVTQHVYKQLLTLTLEEQARLLAAVTALLGHNDVEVFDEDDHNE